MTPEEQVKQLDHVLEMLHALEAKLPTRRQVTWMDWCDRLCLWAVVLIVVGTLCYVDFKNQTDTRPLQAPETCTPQRTK
jgi:hypothetical protein